jgi:hypothetical protein
MFLTPSTSIPGQTGRRQKSDHATVEQAKFHFSQHPARHELEALIYVDGTPAWVGTTDADGRVSWHPWSV